MRDLGHTTGKQLADMRSALAVLLEHEHHINPRIVTDLCVMREQITAELVRRVPPGRLRTVAGEAS